MLVEDGLEMGPEIVGFRQLMESDIMKRSSTLCTNSEHPALSAEEGFIGRKRSNGVRQSRVYATQIRHRP